MKPSKNGKGNTLILDEKTEKELMKENGQTEGVIFKFEGMKIMKCGEIETGFKVALI